MGSTIIRRFGVVLATLAGMGGAALAQSPSCNAWRSELASLQGQRGDARAAQQAQRVYAQLSQVSAQYRFLGCDRFSLFGGAPPQCGGLGAQLNQLQAQYGALQSQAQGGGVEQRRARLAAAIESNCRGAPQQRGFFETIFGLEPRRGEIDSTLPELDPEPQPGEPAGPRQGGAYTVCVRTCDGFFFPLASSPGGREGQDEMCQALCPGTETQAFGMTQGGDIQNAVSRGGTPYSSLPNAGKYLQRFDSTCACRGKGQSWVQALREAEELIDKRKGDVIISEQRAAELSRVKPDPKRKSANPAPVAVPTLPKPEDDQPMPSLNSPTSGTESAGVGPQVVEGEKTLEKNDGLRRESVSSTGEKRTVRIVAPNLAPQLSPQVAPALRP